MTRRTYVRIRTQRYEYISVTRQRVIDDGDGDGYGHGYYKIRVSYTRGGLWWDEFFLFLRHDGLFETLYTHTCEYV